MSAASASSSLNSVSSSDTTNSYQPDPDYAYNFAETLLCGTSSMVEKQRAQTDLCAWLTDNQVDGNNILKLATLAINRIDGVNNSDVHDKQDQLEQFNSILVQLNTALTKTQSPPQDPNIIRLFSQAAFSSSIKISIPHSLIDKIPLDNLPADSITALINLAINQGHITAVPQLINALRNAEDYSFITNQSAILQRTIAHETLTPELLAALQITPADIAFARHREKAPHPFDLCLLHSKPENLECLVEYCFGHINLTKNSAWVLGKTLGRLAGTTDEMLGTKAWLYTHHSYSIVLPSVRDAMPPMATDEDIDNLLDQLTDHCIATPKDIDLAAALLSFDKKVAAIVLTKLIQKDQLQVASTLLSMFSYIMKKDPAKNIAQQVLNALAAQAEPLNHEALGILAQHVASN
jgi:hypothetical protein